MIDIYSGFSDTAMSWVTKMEADVFLMTIYIPLAFNGDKLAGYIHKWWTLLMKGWGIN